MSVRRSNWSTQYHPTTLPPLTHYCVGNDPLSSTSLHKVDLSLNVKKEQADGGAKRTMTIMRQQIFSTNTSLTFPFALPNFPSS